MVSPYVVACPGHEDQLPGGLSHKLGFIKRRSKTATLKSAEVDALDALGAMGNKDWKAVVDSKEKSEMGKDFEWLILQRCDVVEE